MLSLGSCACDANDSKWRKTKGTFTTTNAFPIAALRIGDTDGAAENSYYTLGPLTCVTSKYAVIVFNIKVSTETNKE